MRRRTDAALHRQGRGKVSPRVPNSVKGGIPYLEALEALREHFTDEEICRANHINSGLDILIGRRDGQPMEREPIFPKMDGIFLPLPRRSKQGDEVLGSLTYADALDVVGEDGIRAIRKLHRDGLSIDEIADEEFTTPELVRAALNGRCSSGATE